MEAETSPYWVELVMTTASWGENGRDFKNVPGWGWELYGPTDSWDDGPDPHPDQHDELIRYSVKVFPTKQEAIEDARYQGFFDEPMCATLIDD